MTKYTKYEKVKSMSVEELAKEIIRLDITDEFCDNSCCSGEAEIECPHDVECCVRWLNKEIPDD
ncbi:MAG TPA: hypothetical protein GX523_10675 [Desulfitobacterium dehalogenans]|uniref:Uncharacterized protein n=1 Tax=Desulfitobacterium dehalogenans TaxID=36854 RepID=A0A7C6Z4V8_9FIRM|nr:hypothetical protein [Desulfitobacterium dehalogenans]